MEKEAKGNSRIAAVPAEAPSQLVGKAVGFVPILAIDLSVRGPAVGHYQVDDRVSRVGVETTCLAKPVHSPAPRPAGLEHRLTFEGLLVHLVNSGCREGDAVSPDLLVLDRGGL